MRCEAVCRDRSLRKAAAPKEEAKSFHEKAAAVWDSRFAVWTRPVRLTMSESHYR
jgi:hypothetical protein